MDDYVRANSLCTGKRIMFLQTELFFRANKSNLRLNGTLGTQWFSFSLLSSAVEPQCAFTFIWPLKNFTEGVMQWK